MRSLPEPVDFAVFNLRFNLCLGQLKAGCIQLSFGFGKLGSALFNLLLKNPPKIN